ncbi:MAG: GxxExxY protein [Acidobacteria bacterium]|nr:GxxExxY protein [Acidobacteriota bacterium]
MRELGDELEAKARAIVDAGFQVHRELGPGLLERVYESALLIELGSRGLSVQRQVLVPLHYKGTVLEDPLRLDLLVDNAIILEVKSIEAILAVHKAQLLSYLRLSNLNLGFLMNFNVPIFKDGIRRIVR